MALRPHGPLLVAADLLARPLRTRSRRLGEHPVFGTYHQAHPRVLREIESAARFRPRPEAKNGGCDCADRDAAQGCTEPGRHTHFEPLS